VVEAEHVAPNGATAHNGLAVDGRGRFPVPQVELVILKVAQRCNLDCTYCYVYNRGDESWRTRPAVIGEDVVHTLASRIGEHCERHGLAHFTVELHGGEPLLVGKRRMRTLLDILQKECGSVRPRIILQTNGLLLDEEWLDILAKYRISFGISLDGPPEIADRYRVRRKGRGGSTQQVLETINHLRARSEGLFDALFGGCLCVVDPDTDGAALVRWFADQGIGAVDFLLPDGNRVNPPQGWKGIGPTRRFLLDAFEQWYSMGARAPRIRKFEVMLAGLMGTRGRLDSLGGDLRLLCVVESDGSIGVNDVARICGGEYSRDVLNIFDHPLDLHASRYRLSEVQEVCSECAQCPYLSACGGGYLPHRFDGIGFDNPSLYCGALYDLADRMMEALRKDLPATAWVPANQSAMGG
jgi:uncharacterized protein